MKLSTWFGLVAILFGLSHIIFADTTRSINNNTTTTNSKSDEGRMSKVWEKKVSPPYPYNYRPAPNSKLLTTEKSGKSEIRSVYGNSWTLVDDQRLERNGGHKSYGYGGGGGGGKYYYAQPLYHPPKDHGGLGLYKPLIIVLVVPLFFIFFLVALVSVVRIAVSSSSSAAAAASNQQQQQQQSDNNNNNNANNDNNNNAVVVSSNAVSSFPFFIIINATGRASQEPIPFKRPFLLHRNPLAGQQTLLNDTFLLN